MKISLLVKREPFEKIFENSFKIFLDDITGYDNKVNWFIKKESNPIISTSQFWYCNPLINSIFVSDVRKEVFQSIKGEYFNNPLYLSSLSHSIANLSGCNLIFSLHSSSVNFSHSLYLAQQYLIVSLQSLDVSFKILKLVKLNRLKTCASNTSR